MMQAPTARLTCLLLVFARACNAQTAPPPPLRPRAPSEGRPTASLSLSQAKALADNPPKLLSGREDVNLVYELPLTVYTDPGWQTRTNIMSLFPEEFFSDAKWSPSPSPGSSPDSPGPQAPAPAPPSPGVLGFPPKPPISGLLQSPPLSFDLPLDKLPGRRLSAAPPVADGANGGWTLFSTDSGVVAIHLVALNNGQLLLMERPGNREHSPNIAAVYNTYNNTWRYFPMTDSPFCAGHTPLSNGKLLVVGGTNVNLEDNFRDGRFNVRSFTGGATPSYTISAVMDNYPSSDPNAGGRWYPSLLTMPDGKVLIVSGETTEGGGYGNEGVTFVNPTYQFFTPSTNALTTGQYIALIADTNPMNLYPFTALLPNGRVLIISGVRSRVYTYDPATSTLVNDTTTYPPIPDLPVAICYPQTASVVMLPLSFPNYSPRILVVGGSSVERAGGGTPATANTYLLDLGVRPLTWQVETMSQPRIMPDLNLLPDGTLAIFNGADNGIAGGTPGYGGATNNNPNGRAAEIYNPAAAFGSRMSGILANSGRDRLYHSSTWLTPNNEVLVTGSEATSDYTIQIFTPPYLRGTFVRPVIASPSTVNPAYGATFTVALSYSGGAPTPITRVALTRHGGSTHSTSFDQRQVSLTFTATTTLITITAPPNNTVAPPGVYSLSVIAAGRPSPGVYIGLGGATVLAPYYDPLPTPPLADGTYTISTAGRPAACGQYLTGSLCSDGNNILLGNTTTITGTWGLQYLPHAPYPNTYSVIHYARNGSCNAYAGVQRCSAGNQVFPYPRDLLTGRQWWTFTQVSAGVYTIEIRTGREDCASGGYLTASATCGDTTATLTATSAALSQWTLTPVAAPTRVPQAPFVPILMNGTYTILNQGRPTCGNQLSYQNCADGNGALLATTARNVTLVEVPSAERSNSYNIFGSDRGLCNTFLSATDCGAANIDFFGTDDGSGRQQFVISRAPGGYYLQIISGRTACNKYVSGQTCGTSTALTFAAADGGAGLQTWTITPLGATPGSGGNTTTPPSPPSPPPPVIPTGSQLNISNVGRSSCASFLQPQTCAAGNGVFHGPDTGPTWTFTLVPGAPNNTYTLTSQNRTGVCNQYLSSGSCPGTVVDMFGQDDASGRQRFTITPASNGYTIQIVNGRVGCATYLTAYGCGSGSSAATFATAVDATNLGIWNIGGFGATVGPPPTVPTRYFADGDFVIQSLGRAGTCSATLASGACGGSGDVFLGGGSGTWRLSYVDGAPQPNTYNVRYTARLSTSAGCDPNYLSSTDCGANIADLFGQDDNSGRQQWTFNRTGAGYTITIVRGRPTCGTLLQAATCGSGTTVTFTTTLTASGQELWSVAPPAVTPTSPPVTQVLANGQYYIASVGRTTCNATLSGYACSGPNDLQFFANPETSGLQNWTFTYLPNAPQANTYQITNNGRTPPTTCRSFLSATDCGANIADLFSRDDNSGRQQWVVTPTTGGYTLTLPQGRTGCNQVLSAGACGGAEGPLITFVAANTGSGAQTFSIRPVNPAAG